MGLPKTARTRKGKKAWRKNIDDEEVVEALQQETHQERRGPAVETLKDEQLFFEDKGTDNSIAEQALARRPRAKREKKLTRAQLILQAPQAIKPVVERNPKRKVQALPPPRQQQLAKQQQQLGDQQQEEEGGQEGAAVVPSHQTNGKHQTGLDLWDEDFKAASEKKLEEVVAVAASKAQVEVLKPTGPTSRARGKKAVLAPRIKAVEVDMPGCSYNPEPESHQDALAALVAEENKKLLKKELARPGLPLMDVNLAKACREADELAMLQTDADMDDENEIQLEGQGGTAECTAPAPADDDGGGSSKKLSKKKTKKDRNRAARAAAEAKALEAKRALKRQRAELEALPHLREEVEEEEALRAAKRTRKQVVADEKASIQPPKLSKLKFEDLHVQVLTSDEVGQGLRRLKPYPMLAMERFKSLQKRGLVEVRRPVGTKAAKKVVVYEKGARREKVSAGQADLDALKAANRKAARAVAANA